MAVRGRHAAIGGVYNTAQARELAGETTMSLIVEAAQGALADAGLSISDVDGICAGRIGSSLTYDLGIGPAWVGAQFGASMVAEAIWAVENGAADVVLVVAGQAGEYRDHKATAPWTRPTNEFVVPWGLYTAVEFALIARRHMITYGTTQRQLSVVASTIRNNGHRNPLAIYAGKGPFTPEDIENSRPIADPFHLLDCSMTSEGGCALVIASADRLDASRRIFVLGSGADYMAPSYQVPPAWDLVGRDKGAPAGLLGKQAADRAFAQAGIGRDAVSVLELYDPFSFEIIRQLEAFGFCAPGEGGPFVEDGHIAINGSHPVTTDGGLMSFSHAGESPQMLQRVIRGVQQLRGGAGELQVAGAEVALCSAGGAGAMFNQVVLLGVDAA